MSQAEEFILANMYQGQVNFKVNINRGDTNGS